MDKKDIYEHLAKIYLDTPLRTPARVKQPPRNSKKIIIAVVSAAFLIFVVGAAVFLSTHKSIKPPVEIAHVLQTEAIKVAFDFDPAKKQTYTISLNKLNLAGFKTLAFSAKKSDFQGKLSLRVEMSNEFKEKSEIYIYDVSHRWQQHTVSLSDFSQISDWSEMSNLSFIVEEWNCVEKKGAFYIDNITLLK